MGVLNSGQQNSFPMPKDGTKTKKGVSEALGVNGKMTNFNPLGGAVGAINSIPMPGDSKLGADTWVSTSDSKGGKGYSSPEDRRKTEFGS